MPVPDPTVEAINELPTALLDAPTVIKLVVPLLTIVYALPTTKLPAVTRPVDVAVNTVL